MNKFKSLLLGFATIAAILIPFNGFAQNTDEPIISFRTNLYDMYGETNEFSLVIGGTTAEGYIDVIVVTEKLNTNSSRLFLMKTLKV